MSNECARYFKFGSAILVVLLALAYLAYTGVQESKSYYVTITELDRMGSHSYSKRLRVAGNVVPGSIKRSGEHLNFLLKEGNLTLPVSYSGTEAPPDTFKDDSQVLADGSFGMDRIFHAKQIQAKCASKYAPQPSQPAAHPAMNRAKLSKGVMEEMPTGKDLFRSPGLGLLRPRASGETKAVDVANR